MSTSKDLTASGHSSTKVLTGPISSLPTIGSALVTTSILTEKDEGLRAKVIRCACLECGAELAQGLIDQLSGAREFGQTEIPAISACSNCSGTEFEFRVRPESPRHWVRITERLVQIAPEVREPEIVAPPVKQPISKARWLMIAGGLVIATIMFFVIRYWIFGSPIPLVHQPEKYEFKHVLPQEEPKVQKAISRDELEDEK